MGIIDKKRYSKRELLEIMLAQKIEIERLEQEVIALEDEVEIKDRQIEEMADLVQVTNKLIRLTKIIDQSLKSALTKENNLDE